MVNAARHEDCMKRTRQRGTRCMRFKIWLNDTCFLHVLSVCVCVWALEEHPESCSARDAEDEDDDAAQLSSGGDGLMLLAVVAHCTRSDITSEGGGETHVHKLHVHSHQPQQPPTTVCRVYSCPPRRVCTRAWSLRGYPLASLHTTMKRVRTHTCAHTHPHTSSPETYLSPPMSSRLDVSHGITSTSASLQGPEGQREREQQVLWYQTSPDPVAKIVTCN